MGNRIKRHKSKNETTISNYIMREKEVSLKAKGLYALVMSLPEEWDFSIKGICAIIKEEYTAVNGAIKELIKAGYCTRSRVTEKGKVTGWDYDFYHKKISSPHLDFLNVEKPNVENLNDNNNNNSTIDNSPVIENKEEKRISNDIPKNKRFVKPTVEQINAYIKEMKLHFEAERFFDYYESKGWMVGRTPMKDWKAACRLWEHTCKKENKDEEEKEEWPAGITRDEWDKVKLWLDKHVPFIADEITPEMFLDMKGRAHFKGDVFKDIIIEINNSGYEDDILSEFERLRFTEPYATRIDL